MALRDAIPATLVTAAMGFVPAAGAAAATSAGTADMDPLVMTQSDSFANIDDLQALGQLTDAEAARLIAALANAPDSAVTGGDAQALYDSLSADLQAGGTDAAPQALPALILAARAVACLAPAYTALRGIATDSPDVAAASIAAAISGCVTGGGATVIKDVILAHRGLIANGLRAIGLGSLAAVLSGDTATAASSDPAIVPTRSLLAA